MLTKLYMTDYYRLFLTSLALARPPIATSTKSTVSSGVTFLGLFFSAAQSRSAQCDTNRMPQLFAADCLNYAFCFVRFFFFNGFSTICTPPYFKLFRYAACANKSIFKPNLCMMVTEPVSRLSGLSTVHSSSRSRLPCATDGIIGS